MLSVRYEIRSLTEGIKVTHVSATYQRGFSAICVGEATAGGVTGCSRIHEQPVNGGSL